MTLNKTDIAEKISAETGITKSGSARLLDLLFDTIKDSLAKGESVKIPGLGQFSLNDKSSRQGRNPQTGEPMMITERRVVMFKASNILKEDVTERYAHRMLEDGSEDKNIPADGGNLRAVSWFELQNSEDDN